MNIDCLSKASDPQGTAEARTVLRAALTARKASLRFYIRRAMS